MKKRPTQREKIFANDVTHKGLISKNIRTVHTTQHQKKKKKKQKHTHTPQTTQFLKMGRNLNRHFSKEDTQTANNHIKRCSILINIPEMQVNEIAPHSSQNGYHHNEQKQYMSLRIGEKETLVHYWWKYKLVQPLWEAVSVQFSSVAQSCPTLCDPMNCSRPGLPVHHHLLEFIQTHVY